ELLRRSEERFRALVEYSSDAIALTDTRGNITYVSRSSTGLLGHAVGDIVGKTAFSFGHPDERDRMIAAFARCLEAPGESITVEARARHRDGTYRWLQVVMQNRLSEPSIQAIVANYRDITDRKHVEEERDRFYSLSVDLM